MKDRKLLFYTILGNIGLGVLIAYSLIQILQSEQYLLTLGLLIGSWFVADYIRLLEKRLKIEKTVRWFGRMSYILTCLIGLAIMYQQVF